ncbi:DUF3313 domain-containing protein [Aquitalea sp. FJL05]|uniref:DUF3313 domain-containing protein n=1 Tax=Aquitalea sp. FJL05 TaxID=2153366 RepID=UPI000F59913A|nr:DUF3313 domain-containing protein [Aquitalea sp. FJL05]RQO68603.1 DUF3313 domain-containing protein [Aquitalea sp. FJL05]
MKPFFRLACAIVAMSALSHSAMAEENQQHLFNLPPEAFQPNPKVPGQMVYLKPGADLKQYHAVILEPLSFLERQADGNWQLLVAAEKNKIDRYYRMSMETALRKEHIKVVTVQGPGVARLRVAVTGFQQDKPGLAVSDILPIKAAFNLARFATGTDPYLLKVSTMGQLDDSQDHTLLAGGVNLIENPGSKTKDEAITAELLKKMISNWTAKNARQLAHALSPAK